jgi:hypothetical protein
MSISDVSNALLANGFKKMHSCGCAGGESSWTKQGSTKVVRVRFSPKLIEIRDRNRHGKILASFKLDEVNQAIESV